MGLSVTTVAAQMPIWDEKVRGLPNSFARSALFCVGSRTERRNLKNEQVAALNDTVIRYTGTELRQDDEDVFLQLVHLARGQPISDGIVFSAYSMLKELGWGSSGRSYERLRDSIDRLKANALKVSWVVDKRHASFSGSLIRKFAWMEEGQAQQSWRVWFEKEVVDLFGNMSYSEIEWQQRTRLKGEISKWLLGFYYTAVDCPPMELEMLRRLCGSRCNDMPAFRQMLKKALQELQDVGFLAKWKVEQDYVYVSRDANKPINRIRPNKLLAAATNNSLLEEKAA